MGVALIKIYSGRDTFTLLKKSYITDKPVKLDYTHSKVMHSNVHLMTW